MKNDCLAGTACRQSLLSPAGFHILGKHLGCAVGLECTLNMELDQSNTSKMINQHVAVHEEHLNAQLISAESRHINKIANTGIRNYT